MRSYGIIRMSSPLKWLFVLPPFTASGLTIILRCFDHYLISSIWVPLIHFHCLGGRHQIWALPAFLVCSILLILFRDFVFGLCQHQIDWRMVAVMAREKSRRWWWLGWWVVTVGCGGDHFANNNFLKSIV